MRLALKAWIVLAILSAIGFAPTPGHAQVSPIQSCVSKLADGHDTSATTVQHHDFPCDTKQTALGSGDFVTKLVFAPVLAKVHDPLVLRLGSDWQESARITFRFADGDTEQIEFNSRNVGYFMTIGAIWEFPIPVRSSLLEAVFIETRGSANVRGVVLSPELATRSESYARGLALTSAYCAFAGLAVVLLAYNISLWAAMRHSFQLWYCAMVSLLALYTFSSSGALAMLASGLDNNDRLRLNYALLVAVGASTLLFVRHFFGDEAITPRLNRLLHVTIALSAMAALAFAVLAPWQIRLLDTLYFIAITIMLSMVVPLLISARRNGNRYVWIFLVAWAAPILAAILRVANGFNLLPHSTLIDNANILAQSLEAVLSALLVTARVRELGVERDRAIRGERTARRLAAIDPLTGLMNRRAFIDRAIGRPGRHRLMLIDIDHFKSVNDRFGHDIGDEVLRAVTSVIQSSCPQNGLAVRLGGEEFALLIPELDFATCRPEMVLKAIRSEPMPRDAHVTVSIGHAEGPMASEESWKRLYRLADSALYRAKTDGRDRCCSATGFQAA